MDFKERCFSNIELVMIVSDAREELYRRFENIFAVHACDGFRYINDCRPSSDICFKALFIYLRDHPHVSLNYKSFCFREN